MKALGVVGLLLVVMGITGLFLEDVSVTESEKVAEFGAMKITNEKQTTYPISTEASVAALLSGLVIIAIAAFRK